MASRTSFAIIVVLFFLQILFGESVFGNVSSVSSSSSLSSSSSSSSGYVGAGEQVGGDPSKKVAAVDIMAVEGKSVMLPCNVTPPGHDKVYMVFWFQDDAGIPLYSFDVRGKPLAQARHWSAPEVFGSRAYFRTVAEPAQLVIDDIRRRDEGVYRCRVDFRNTQTRSFRYNLTVIVPPEQPVILDRWGRKLERGVVGPHEEGDDVALTCRAVGGRPPPTVRWLMNGEPVTADVAQSGVASVAERRAGDVVESRLAWPSVRRADLHAVLTCQALNTPLTEPREATVVLDLHLKPLTVTIRKADAPLVADRRYEVICESTGSRPAAIITWYKGKRQLKRTKEDIRDNVTISELSFVPTTEDDGKPITCRAENPNVTGLFKEESWSINVVYPPIVSLRLGSTLNADDIKEGDDVYFECHVRSNPSWRRLTWMHDGEILNHNMSARIIRSNQSLVLQRVTRYSAGQYACSAINSEGETISKALTFRVKYAPTCRNDRISVVGASRAESLDIACDVDADPPARRYRWKFNNSGGETLDVAPERFTSTDTRSVLRYTPVSELDYGTLACWATNSVGEQARPCLFQVVAAGKPFPVRNCSLSNQTSNSVEVSCLSSFDGGLPQRFVLELYASASGVPRFNMTAYERPHFLLQDLEPDVAFRVVVFAVNAKGRAPGAIIDDITFRDAEKRTAVDGDIAISPILGVIVGIAFTLVIIIFCVVVKVRHGLRTRGDNATNNTREEKHAVSGGLENNTLGGSDSRLLHHRNHHPLIITSTGVTGTTKETAQPDECDPDVIPSKYEPGSPKQVKVCLNGPPVILRGGTAPLDNVPMADPPAYTTQWVTPGPPPPPVLSDHSLMYHQYANPTTTPAVTAGSGAAATWDSRPKDLRLAGATPDIELNGMAIKERLMASRLPESCV